MFKNAATKIAHNSTIPSIGGNKDLRPLQDLITAEKSVLVSLRKLSSDFTKASEALRGWGMGEGDDLGDTLSASTVILALFSDALAQYATHEQLVRDHMKAIRTREEGLDELRRQRKNVAAKADSAEKKLNKMSPEHKQLAVQTDLLHRLRDEIRQLDTEIMTEEARLGDFKRTTTRSLMGLKFGGLQELSAKGAIVGGFGKQIIAEIHEDVTQPGLPRNFYNGHGKTESCIGEAERSAGEVVFSGITNQADPPSFRPPDFPPGPNFLSTGPMNPGDISPSGSTSYQGAPQLDPYTNGSMQNTNISQPGMYDPSQPSPTQAFPSSQYQSYTYDRRVDEFGVGSSSSAPLSPRLGAGPGGGKFATFPVKVPNPNLRDDTTPSLGPRYNRAPSLSFSSQVEQALVNPPTTSGFSPPNPGGTGFDDPVPVYEVVPSPTYPTPPGPPPGAASDPPPAHPDGAMVNPWSEESEAEENHNNHGEHETPPGTSGDEAGDVHLAYMSSASDISYRDADRRVRFGTVSDVDQEMEERRRQSEDESGYDDLATITSMDGPDEARTPTVNDPEPTPSPPSDKRSRRIPVPVVNDPTEESTLNAAAAREVGREMDALTFNPPPVDRGNSSPLPAPPLALYPTVVRNINQDEPVPVTGPSIPDKTSFYPTSVANKSASPLQIPLQHTVPPPHINLPDRSVSSFSSSNTGSPYRTPLESPFRTPSGSPPRPPVLGIASLGTGPTNKPPSSLSPPSVPPGARTISAAAFKRQSPRMSVDMNTPPVGGVGPADTTPLTFKKRTLPSSPYPQRLQPQPASREPSTTNLRASPVRASAPLPSPPADAAVMHRRVPSSVPQNASAEDDYDQFDYITAYVSTMGPEPDDGNPTQADYGRLGQSRVVNASGAGETSPGYGQGRFATNLDGGGLR